MKIRLLTITHKVPSWVKDAYHDYAKRLSSGFQLELIEIPAKKRTSQAMQQTIDEEGEKILAACKQENKMIVLDVKGVMLSTEQLSGKLSAWQLEGKHLDIIIGGPDGLSQKVIQKAAFVWSLSPLTFPHFLVRIILAEQVYRAQSILINHPYHRG